jgi:hypothetical protein
MKFVVKKLMKIILSRKGVESTYGTKTSPILPDGTLLSIPIPSSTDIIRYRDLKTDNWLNYHSIIKKLKPN